MNQYPLPEQGNSLGFLQSLQLRMFSIFSSKVEYSAPHLSLAAAELS